MTWAGGRLERARIKSSVGNPLYVRYGEKKIRASTRRGQVIELDSSLAR